MRVLLLLCLLACSRPHGAGPASQAVDAAAPVDADPNACAPGVAIGAPCAVAGATCNAHCTACGPGIFTNDPDPMTCIDDPASPGTLKWTTYDEIDCFPVAGDCPGTFTDASCTMPFDCPACGMGAHCMTPSDCCDGTTCLGGFCRHPITCHVDGEPCSDGIACCGGMTCDATGHCPFNSCQPAGAECRRGGECCVDTGGCNSDDVGICVP